MNIALILSGGQGTRLGSDIPKQYIKVRDRMIIDYCIQTLINNHRIDGIQIVADHSWQEVIKQCFSSEKALEKLKGFSEPGANRQLSILNGLRDIKQYADSESYVMVHDAARPLLSDLLIDECFEAVVGHDGVLPVLPMKDTVYLSKDGKGIAGLLNRQEVFAGQAPEVFQLDKYLKANERLLPKDIFNINGSTEPAIMAGFDVIMIPGDEGNFKITTMEDLERFESIQNSIENFSKGRQENE